jgi:hypothetical protein
MTRLKLDSAAVAVKKFIRELPLGAEGLEIELNGQVVCKIIAPQQLSDRERQAILERGRAILKRSLARNKGIPARVVDREVSAGVAEVRRRKKA